MTLARIALVAASLALSLIAGCGGGGANAALQVQQYPGDREATPRRLEALAREYENTFGCTETDTIQITGMAPGVYSVQGCNAMRDYMIGCRPGPYGAICSWQAMPDIAQQAAIDLNCGPQYIDVQPGVQGQRVVEGCGFRAVYMMRCGGNCTWTLSGPVMQATPDASGGGSYTY